MHFVTFRFRIQHHDQTLNIIQHKLIIEFYKRKPKKKFCKQKTSI